MPILLILKGGNHISNLIVNHIELSDTYNELIVIVITLCCNKHFFFSAYITSFDRRKLFSQFNFKLC